MKLKHLLLTIAIFTLTLASFAQNPITTLQHAGATQVFYGQNSFIEAYNTSVNGDTLNLSVGGFTPPSSIAKGITIIGAGHFPDAISFKRRTTITGTIYINSGADNLHLEGLYINGHVYFESENLISNVKFIRSRLENVIPYNSHPTLNNCSFEECFVEGYLAFSGMTTNDNLLVKHCVIYNVVELPNGLNAVFDGNIFIYTPPGIHNPGIPIYRISGATIMNNIFLSSIIDGYSCFDLVFYNNIFVASSVNLGINGYGNNNYLGVPQADIFVNQTGNTIDYTHDYHLKNPELYIGTDGSQVGLYGGPIPYKEGGLPSNPQITSKSVAAETDASGNLYINFTVKAQEN